MWSHNAARMVLRTGVQSRSILCPCLTTSYSWEIGNRALAVLTLSHSPYSLFHSSPLPPSTLPPPSISPVFSIAYDTVTKLHSPGISQALEPYDASAADPASIGIAVLLANLTHQGGADYAGAARGQLDFLHSNQVPKSTDGAMSHEREKVQLWCVTPPSLLQFDLYLLALCTGATSPPWFLHFWLTMALSHQINPLS